MNRSGWTRIILYFMGGIVSLIDLVLYGSLFALLAWTLAGASYCLVLIDWKNHSSIAAAKNKSKEVIQT